MKHILEYIHRPNKTEVGVGTNTNDSYLKLSTAIEESEMFLKNKEEKFLHSQSGEDVIFKAIKYQTGSKEYRLTKLGAVRTRFDIECGDELIFRREVSDKYIQPVFEIKKFKKTMFYPSSKGRYILVYAERLPNWNEDGKTELAVWYKGSKESLEISFLERKKARADSPDFTDYYSVLMNGNELNRQTFCLSYRKGEMYFEAYDKWKFNEIKY